MENEEAIKYLKQIYPNGGHCWLDEQRIEAIGMAIEVLRDIERNGKDYKEEPVSEDLEHAVTDYLISIRLGDHNLTKAFKAGANWQKEQDKQWLAENHKHIFNNGYEEGFEAGRDDAFDETEECVSDDFEEACNQMSKAAIISKCEAGKPFFSDGDFKLGFKAGASWQKQKDDEMLTKRKEDDAIADDGGTLRLQV